MRKTNTTRIHGLAGVLALLLVTSFFVSSITVELTGDHGAVAYVKNLVLIGICVLIPSMAVTGATGRLNARGGSSPIIRAKQLRILIIAAIGLGILVPCAVILQRLSAHGDFGTTFYAVQAIELAGGAVNITLISLNVRAGLIMTGRVRKGRAERVRSAPPGDHSQPDATARLDGR